MATARITKNNHTNGHDVPKPPWFRLMPEDGWLTVVLLMLAVYITIFSIQAVDPPWAPGMGILTLTTGAGLLLGLVAVQQGRIPSVLVHSVFVALGIVIAFFQTADAVVGGNRQALLLHTWIWIQRAVLRGGQSSDNAVFLLCLGILTFLLAYISVWLVLRTRRPWLFVLANGVVLLINLNSQAADKYIFLLLFLLVTLLLLVRFTLAENMRQWRMRGLRFSPDLSWDFMQAGAIFAVTVLLLAYLLPSGTALAGLNALATSKDNPLNEVQSKFGQLFAGLNGTGKGGLGGDFNFFGNSYTLQSKVNLPDTEVLHYQLSSPGSDGSQFLITQTYDTYDGTSQWSSTQGQEENANPGIALPSSSEYVSQDSYIITFDDTPPNGQISLFAPGSEAAGFSVASTYVVNTASGVTTRWTANRPLRSGESYTAVGYVSTAAVKQLQAVPWPAQAKGNDKVYPPGVLQVYLPENNGYISQQVRDTALAATKGTVTMYDAAVALEDYLRAGFTYTLETTDPPPGEDAVSWFLRNKKGFCTFFASAMALMGRSLGMPTRVAIGFASGSFDAKRNVYVVKGTQAHMWTQVYFAQYGWINFEPTSGQFSKFTRPEVAAGAPTPATSGTPGATSTKTVPINPRDRTPDELAGGGTAPQDSPVVKVGLGLSGLVIIVLVAAAAFLLWWRLLYRGLSPAAMAFARLTRLGRWAGAPPLRAQTPNEFVERLGTVVPAQREALRQVGEIYSRERWGGRPSSATNAELPRLYERIQRSVTPVIARRLRRLPGRWMGWIRWRS